MHLNRRTKTLIYLLIATVTSWMFSLSEDVLTCLSPVLLGAGLLLSNYKYCKKDFSGIIIILGFIIVFLCGTLPFYAIGQLASDNFFIIQTFGFFGAFALITLTIKLALKGIVLGYVSILMIFIFPLIVSMLLGMLINHNALDLRNGDSITRFDLTILIVQFLMSILIVSTLKNDNSTS